MTTVGFTGSSLGLAPVQLFALHGVLGRIPDLTEFHHGDDGGADLQAHHHVAALRAAGTGVRIVVHPPANPRRRAYAAGDVVLPPAPYLTRNRDLVNALAAAGGFLVAAPGGTREVLRSGTWATVRYARKRGVPVVLVWPDGRVTGDDDDASRTLAGRLG